MGFQAAKRTEGEPTKVLLQLAKIMSTQAHIVDEISRALKVAQIHVVEFLAKMLLCLQHLKPNGLEPPDNRLDFKLEILAHREK
jgi:hypothetical protein